MKTKTLLTFAAVALLGSSVATGLFAQSVFLAPPATSVQQYPSTGYSTNSYPVANATMPPQLPADVGKIIAQLESEKADIQKKARRQGRELRIALVASLQELLKRYAKDAKLDEAVAIRDCLRELEKTNLQSQPDPGTLSNYSNAKGSTLFFRVTGNKQATVYGANPYTTDSGLASAAVHAGVLKLGQTAVIKVKILPGQKSYQGTTRNGITSISFGYYPASYKVEAVTGDDEDAADSQPQPAQYGTPQSQPGYFEWRSAPADGTSATPPRDGATVITVSPGATPYTPQSELTQSRARMYTGVGTVLETREMRANVAQYQAVTPGQIPGPNPIQVMVTSQATPFAAPTLPGDACQLIATYQAESAKIHKAANRKIAAARRDAVAKLKPLQDTLTRDMKLDEALVVRNCIGALKQPPVNVLPDPGALSQFANSIGNVYYFRATGARNDIIWGTDIYTTDSALAATTVHAGVLNEGQTGIVKVTILPGQMNYQGMPRNGITSNSYGQYPTSYRVERANDDDTDAAGEDDDRKTESTATPSTDKSQADELKRLRSEVTRLQRALDAATVQLREKKQTPRNPAIQRSF